MVCSLDCENMAEPSVTFTFTVWAIGPSGNTQSNVPHVPVIVGVPLKDPVPQEGYRRRRRTSCCPRR